MFTLKVVLAFTGVAAWVCLTHALSPQAVDLVYAVNRTVCPIKEVVDEDPYRVPRIIMQRKCDPNPNQWCVDLNIPPLACCQYKNFYMYMECVEIHDKVMVKYPTCEDEGEDMIYNVAIGCACMVGHANPVSTIPPPP